ncbi:MAG: type II secretion system protein GspG [Kiritimatiellae bacterium]|nr:type II secretion system protein GspG [Kiritimatiellia bacterium]
MKTKPVLISAKSAFTLIEILVVISIMIILVGIVGINVLNKPGEARVTAAKAQIEIFKTALQIYYTEQGRYPSQEQGLEALIEKPTRGPVTSHYPKGGYLDTRTLPLDPWDHEYVYLIPGRQGERIEIISYGNDGEPGGTEWAADISSSDVSLF